ncbi:hypothetical protein [Aquimarina algicola]|uniref:Uncharacterized protein n=1 Tax=Aquimarina algicola TaxID=2589995 RepID=A0A504J9W2_9FLAO|nr:hypothetical protein [Aquimarina algicola]TPN87726.1 hypothetical protein FHK87_09115 [Aquimarina algicola]
MKKKLEAELISIAHRILRLNDKSTLPQLQEEARQLYEKLTILTFSEAHFAGPQPTIGQIKSALETNEVEDVKEIGQKEQPVAEPKPVVPIVPKEIAPVTPVSIPLEEKESKKEVETTTIEQKPEIIIEEVNARVTEDLFVPASVSKEEQPVSKSIQHPKAAVNPEADDKPRSLNDQLKKEIHIGLNDRLAFIKNLFDGNPSDYNRVLSQLGTIDSKTEAETFINTMIKPDYNHWEGKDEYAERFMNIVLSKYEY